MAVQQLTQPILNPIAAFDATKEQTISFVVIGGAQVVANRLVIQDNQTGVEIYSNIESTLKLEHTIPANTLKNGGYYNAVVYTLDNSNTLSSPSTPVPFYCYTQPLLTITNIPATETIENGTYTFEGSYSQIEGELLNSYQFTLYDSNKEVLSQTPLIYYETDSSLSYTFVGMNNDTSYYIELSGQTLNNTSMSTGLLYFTVRYIQPASFAICDLVNDCKDGYVQISSNIVAIDGHSNPDPPIYIDDKEVDLRDPDSYVEWNSGFRIQDDFTMRAWGRDFNDYQNIITLTNDINTEETPNKIELKWMLGDVVKEQLSYEDINGELINVSDSVTAPIKNLEIYGNSIQVDRNADVYVEGKSTQEVQATSFKTATGNPVTITDGELDKPVKLGQLDGKSTQATRSGKNKFNIDILPSRIYSGGTFTQNTAAISKYSVTGNRIQATDVPLYNTLPGSRIDTSVDKTFTISFFTDLSTVLLYYTQYDSSGAVIVNQRYSNAKPNFDGYISKTFTFDNNSSYVNIGFGNDTVSTYYIENVQIEKGTSATDYEPYGASPSPEFPSEIKSVGDDVNLFDGNYTLGTIDASGKEQTSSTALRSGYIEVKGNDNYILSSPDNASYIRTLLYDKNKTFIKTVPSLTSFLTTKDTKYFRFVISGTDTNTRIKFQKGTVATSYSEYGKGTVTIEQRGKNLGKNNIVSGQKGGLTITKYDDDTFRVQGTTTGDVYIFGSKNNIDLEAGTYILSGCPTGGSSQTYDLFLDGVNGSNDYGNERTFSITEHISSNYVLRIRSGQTVDFIVKPMLRFATIQDNAYEPYFSKDYVIQTTPLRSLPNGTKDTIEEGTHRKVGQKILSANDISDLLTSYSIPCARIKKRETLGMPTTNILNAVMMTSYSDAGKVNFQNTANGQFNAYQDRYYLNIFDERFTDLETAKSLLEGEEINYELSEEVVEPFTDEQLEVLDNIKTQEGTNIFDAQTNMELKYNYNYEIPSPEVESPIKSEGESWNIFNKNGELKTFEANRTILDTGVRATTIRAGTNKYIGIELGGSELLSKQITLGATMQPSAENVPQIYLFYGNSTSVTVKPSTIYISGTGSKSKTGTIASSFPENCDRVWMLLYGNAAGTGNVGDYVDYTNLQVYEGTEEKPYRPYGYNAFIENKGKNLWDNSNYATNISTGLKIQDNGFKFTRGTQTGGKYVAKKIHVEKGKTYTFSSTYSFEGTENYLVIYRGSVYGTQVKCSYSQSLTYDSTNDEDLYFTFIIDSSTSNGLAKNIQVEKGSVVSSYQPYFYNSYTIPLNAPLRRLPKGTKDILNNKGITRRVGKIVLNGSENWEGFISSYKNTIRAQVKISDMRNIGNAIGLNIMSSHFLPKDLYGHDIVGIEHTYNQLFIRINKYDLDEISLNGFKAWLAAHPTEVIYELATTQNESYEGQTPSPDTPSPIISVGDVKNLIDVPDFNVDYNQQYYQDTNTKFLLKPNYTYTLSFDFNINKSSTDLYYSLGYGTDIYAKDITKTTIYSTQTKGRNEITFTVPADIPDNSYLWVRFARTIILADINIDISNIQLEKGKEDTGYQPTTDYNIYPTVSSKNLFDYDNPLYIRTNNLNYNEISNGYHMSPISVGENTEFTIGIENCFNEGDIYALSFSQLGEFGYMAMYKTLKGTQERIDIIDLTNNIFTAPSQNYDLELVFSMSSSALSNSLEIWSIQIEANNTQTTYETHEENSSIITLDTPLNRIGDYADWVGNISPNLLNPVTGSAIVEENTDYFYNKKSTYTASVTIQYKNADGNVISSETLTNDSTISTPENCVEIHIEGLNEQAIKTNHLQIRKGNSNKPYLPYITEPSLIKVTGKIVLDGSENWGASGKVFHSDYFADYTRNDFIPISNYFIGLHLKSIASQMSIDKTIAFGNSVSYNRLYIRYDDMATVDTFKTWLSTHNTEVIYVLEEPKIIPLSSLNSEALKTLETYEPISNVYTNNKLLGTLDLDYANGKDMKEVQNAYVLLKCWNGNKMPYVIHSNYIDIPESTENIFIWMRRKKNIFDLRIENLTKGD